MCSHLVVTVRPVLNSRWDLASSGPNSSGKSLTSPEVRKQDKALSALFHLDLGYTASVEIVPNANRSYPQIGSPAPPLQTIGTDVPPLAFVTAVPEAFLPIYLPIIFMLFFLVSFPLLLQNPTSLHFKSSL